MNRIAKNYFLDVTYELFALFVPLITAPYLTRVLHAEKYGVYSYVQSAGGIIITLSLLGVYAYGNRQIAYCRDNREELSQTFWELMTLRLVLGLIGTCAYYIYSLKSDYTYFFWLYYPYFLANILDCSWVYVGMENMLPCVLKNLVAKILTLIGVFLIVRDASDVWKYILLVSSSSLIVNLSVYSQLRGIVTRLHIEKANILKHLKGSVALFLPTIASLIYLQMDKVMLEWLTGATEQVSYYDQAEKIVTIPLSIITALSTVMMPRIANDFKKGNNELIKYHINKAARYSLFLAFPLTIGIASIATKLIPWYLGEEYKPTGYAMILISPIVISNTLLGITGKQYFTATNKMGIITGANSFAATINLIVNWLLIPTYGYIGAAIATLISSFTNVLIQLFYMNKEIKIWPIFKRSFRYFVLAGIMGIAIIVVTIENDLAARPQTTIIQILVGVTIYFMSLLIIKDSILSEIIAIFKFRK